MAELNTEDVRRNTGEESSFSGDKYDPTLTEPDRMDQETPGEDRIDLETPGEDRIDLETTGEDKWNFPTTTADGFERLETDKDTLDGDNTYVEGNKLETSNKERRKNNRLQSGVGAKPDKYSNAYRFPGGHGKVNEHRQKPSTGQQNISNQTDQRGPRERSSENNRRSNDRRHDGSPGHSGFVHRETEDFVFFWREGSPFSQWHRAKFTIDDMEFNCAEQYMMYHKAKSANDDAMMDLIIREQDPKAQKGYGRQIPNFDHALWETMREDVVKRGNIAKFSQNLNLRESLFNTYPKTLVEASPHDQVWGIGLTAYDSDALNKKTWRGENLLGKILTEVRDELLKEVGFL